jgi:hypothetical protein
VGGGWSSGSSQCRTYLIRNQTTTKREQQCIGEFFVKILKQGVVKVGRVMDFLDF